MALGKLFLGVLLGSATVLGQQPVWAQCGGKGWTGSTQCASGSCCKYSNEWYSQCIPGSCTGEGGGSEPVTTTRPPAPVTTTTSAPGGSSTAGASNLSPGCGKTPMSSGTKSVNVNGRNRQFIVRVPNGYDRNKSYKLIFAFHWNGGTMNDVASGGSDKELWAYYGQQRVGGESAILVAPQGINNGWANSGGADIRFVDAMVKAIESELCVNQRQRFSVGFSYGAAMSYSIACSRGKDFRGVAVISGGTLSGCAGSSDPVAYLGIHGISDSVLPIASGRTLRDHFVGINGCNRMNPPEPARGSGRHTKTDYTGCKAGYPVSWIAFDGGHAPAPVDGGGDSGARSYIPGEIHTFFDKLS